MRHSGVFWPLLRSEQNPLVAECLRSGRAAVPWPSVPPWDAGNIGAIEVMYMDHS